MGKKNERFNLINPDGGYEQNVPERVAVVTRFEGANGWLGYAAICRRVDDSTIGSVEVDELIVPGAVGFSVAMRAARDTGLPVYWQKKSGRPEMVWPT